MITTLKQPELALETDQRLEPAEVITDREILEWMRNVQTIDQLKSNRVTETCLDAITSLIPPDEHFSVTRALVVQTIRSVLTGMIGQKYSEDEIRSALSMLGQSGIQIDELINSEGEATAPLKLVLDIISREKNNAEVAQW